jgi:glutaminyl-peptide cyclotransferase
MRVRAAALILVAATPLAASPPAMADAPRRGEIRVRAVHPHDSRAFTQGLLWHDGRLYESVGGYGSSALREVDVASGTVLREVALARDEFGEGLALVGERLIQLTWREGIARFWRRADFAADGVAPFAGEGWGLTFDGSELVQSDGTSTLTFRSVDDLTPRRTLRVTREGRPEAYLNELEWVEGALYANVWQSEEIVRIDPGNGRVVAVYDASALLTRDERAAADVLNGIAWNAQTRRFYLTGKFWPKLFEVELLEPER